MATAIEYGLIAALIAVAGITAAKSYTDDSAKVEKSPSRKLVRLPTNCGAKPVQEDRPGMQSVLVSCFTTEEIFTDNLSFSVHTP